MTSEICSGLRVLDLSRTWTGALATLLLADAGAEVIKIEAPGGDPTWKHYASPLWHRGKKSAFLDLKTPDGRDILKRLAARSDVLLHTLMPGAANRLGADYRTLKQANPGLVYCSVSGFGPLKGLENVKGYDAVVAAHTGRFHVFRKQLDREGPKFGALPVASFGAGMLALQGILSALLVREQTGRGQKVETSLLQSLIAYDWYWLMWQLERRGLNPRLGWPDTEPTPQYFVCPTRDGRWLQMANAMEHLFYNWIIGIGLGDYLADPRFSHFPNTDSREAEEELYQRMFNRMEERSLDDWTHTFMTDVDAASEPFRQTCEAFTHPQVVSNAHTMTVETLDGRLIKQPSRIATFTETPVSITKPAPSPGQHTAEVISLSRNGYRRSSITPNGSRPQKPLEGLTIIDFASWIATPLGPSILADLGLRVIKVEPLGGEPWRSVGLMGLRTHQSKESVAVDLKTREGRAIVHRLIQRVDGLVHNLRPGVPERLGIDYDTLSKINPGLVYLYGAGYGSKGPYSHRSVMHPIPGAVAGGALYQAGLGTPPPPDSELSYEETRRIAKALSVSNEANPDVSASMVVAVSLLMALYVKKKTGKGQYVEPTMVGTGLFVNSDDYVQFSGKPSRRLPDPDLLGIHALYRMYRSENGWLFLACDTVEEWEALCRSLDRGDLISDPRFSTPDSRLENDKALAAVLATVFKTRPASEWQDFLVPKGVACVTVYPDDFSDFVNTDPRIKEAGLMVDQEHPVLGKYMRYGPMINFSETKGANLGPITVVGEQTASVLAELGYTTAQIKDFSSRKIVVCGEA